MGIEMNDFYTCLDIEPDLDGLVKEGGDVTWGHLKGWVHATARRNWADCWPLDENPYVKGTWSHRWWHEEHIRLDA
jgi:hypothetical protein